MRKSPRRRHGGAASARRHSPFFNSLTSLLTLSSISCTPANAFNFTPAPSSNVDLRSLGSVGIAGDFTGVSLFQYEEQKETAISTNGSEGLMTRLPNGAFTTILQSDASIMSMCSFIQQDGTDAGVVLGGNFTSLGNQQATAIGLFNPNTSAVTPMSGLSGKVNTVFCDQEHNSVYVGGSFVGQNSTNAIAWTGNEWAALPFSGFNGPVTSITKASNGHIIFGGSFTGLGGNATTPSKADEQIINLSTANITSAQSATTAGFSDPTNIVCKTSGADGAGNTWLLKDNTPGFWKASFGFGFQPTKLRLWNTHQDGRGTKTFRFTAIPLNGIMNFTYTDPATNQNQTCTSECPLSQDSSLPYQDFHFVNEVGMNAFQIDISDWYGNGGGLNGIELFQNDIFAYAISSFNEPACAVDASQISNSTTTGPWKESPSFQSSSKYLTAQLSLPITASSARVVFYPDISQAGNYSVNLYTPGCTQDGTCNTRGEVNVTVNLSQDGQPTSVQLFQSNNFDKYDQIYFGAVDATSSSFRPSVTLAPVNNGSADNMTIVAQRVGFTLTNSTGGLNGLYEYDPALSTVNTSDFSTSTFDKLGSTFSSNSSVADLATAGDITYIAGNFTADPASNIVSVNSKSSAVESLGDSLNGAVSSILVNGTNLFVGGRFTSTQNRTVTDLTNIAVYDTDTGEWSPVGAGVDGPVLKVAAMTMNITGGTPEVVIAFTGSFRTLLAFSNNTAVSVNGFGIWVPSQSNWLQNIDLPVESLSGILTASLLEVAGSEALYGGSLLYSQVGASGVVSLFGAGVRPMGVNVLPTPTTSTTTTSSAVAAVKRRDTLAGSSLPGVITGLFDTSNDRNKTVLAGHFSAESSTNGLIQNLLFIDNKNNGAVTGLSPGMNDNSTFTALAITGDTLFAGGNVSGTINNAAVSGLISYNIASDKYNTQPPSLTGGNNTVTAIRVRPSSSDVYVGGSFTSAGSLGCPAVCFFSTSAGQWNRPGTNLGRSNVNNMVWSSDTTLVAGGSLLVNDSSPTYLAKYDQNNQVWDSFQGSDAIPGPVQVLALGASDGSQLWVAGTANNGSLYLMKYDGNNWIDAFGASGQTLQPGTNIRSLQIFSVSSNHDDSGLLDKSQLLMLTGSIGLSAYGTVSAAVFNGTTFSPYALTTSANNTGGSISTIFVENANFFTASNRKHLPLVGVVLISLAISLVLMLLIVAAGLLLDRIRKKRQGYVPAPSMQEGVSRIPPQELLESLGRPRAGAPRV